MTASGFWRYRGDGTTPEGDVVKIKVGADDVRYRADRELAVAVNTALALEQPLLVTGAPGTGKTTLADSIAAELQLPSPIVFPVRSDHQGRDLLYTFDNLQRFYDAHVSNAEARSQWPYFRPGPLGKAFAAPGEVI